MSITRMLKKYDQVNMVLDNQEELIFQLKNHSEKGFKLLHQLYGKKVFNLAYKITGNKEDARDITQETFIRVYRSIDSFREESRLFTWVYTIAKNISFRHIQNKKRSSTLDLENLIHLASSFPEKSEYSKIEKEFYISQVKEGCLLGLLRCLPLNQRLTFVFHLLLNVSIQDISIILDKSENAIRTLLHRARTNIKMFLCRNCSLYNENNPCKCENLIEFSLKKNWLNPIPPELSNNEFSLTSSEIEQEIHYLKKITELYKSLPDKDLPSDLIQTIQKSILFSLK